jgi:uncharacterized repeat protein (TIGR03803 family)
VIHRFDYTDGYLAMAGVVQGTDGKLYGTTFGGGCGQQGQGEGCGTAFKITTGGNLKRLYVFCSQGGNQCTDGLGPADGLVQGTDEKFYGTTVYGGTGYGNNNNGTVFNITASGKLTTLYSFCSESNCTDGANPQAGLVQDGDGSFYGTTLRGGTKNYGTVFKITPRGKLTTLYSFCSQGGQCPDGAGPEAGLVLGADGKFYGTTYDGGAKNGGTVFSITANGGLTSIYSFCAEPNCADGDEPQAALVQGTDGNFYGTNNDSVFSITASGKLTTLYSFCSLPGCADGSSPVAGLVHGTDGNFYGTTEYGGITAGNCNIGCGTIFQITPRGVLTTLYDFCSQGGNQYTDGVEPLAGLVQDTNGTFYGTTPAGGTDYLGVVFSLSMGLGPFIETRPTSGAVGTAVTILGTGLTNVTNVRFNGIESKFTIVSGSEITTSVPTGATTGPVRVIIPTGKLQSNVPFRVMP